MAFTLTLNNNTILNNNAQGVVIAVSILYDSTLYLNPGEEVRGVSGVLFQIKVTDGDAVRNYAPILSSNASPAPQENVVFELVPENNPRLSISTLGHIPLDGIMDFPGPRLTLNNRLVNQAGPLTVAVGDQVKELANGEFMLVLNEELRTIKTASGMILKPVMDKNITTIGEEVFIQPLISISMHESYRLSHKPIGYIGLA